MKPSDPGHHLIRRYLLGQLPDPSQQSLEEGFMTGDTSLEELEAAEDELVDEYLAGRLSNHERDQFEKYFLSTPEREQKLRFAKVFHQYAAANQAPSVSVGSRTPTNFFGFNSWPARIAALALILVAMSGIWLYRSRQTQPSFATITLSPSFSNRSDGAEVKKVKLLPNSDSLKVIMNLPAGRRAASYRAELENQAGETTTTQVLEETFSSLTIAVPASQLKPGQYVVKLFAKSDAGVEQRVEGNYFFTVE
jgi:hypothetical protein